MSPTEMRNAAKKQNIDDALIAANRAKLEAEFEEQGEREIYAIRRSNGFRPHRPKRKAGHMAPVFAQAR